MKISQTDKVLRHLRDYGAINPAQAMNDYGIFRLAARIKDLRDLGYYIETEYVRSTNRYGETVRFAEYQFPQTNNATRQEDA